MRVVRKWPSGRFFFSRSSVRLFPFSHNTQGRKILNAFKDSQRPLVPTNLSDVAPAVLTGLAVQPAAATIAKGLTQSFTVVGKYSDGSQKDLTWPATWTAVDVMGTSVASVSSIGLALGKNVGKAAVTASYLGQSSTAILTVTAAAVTSLAVDPDRPAIAKKTTQQFHATGSLSDGSTQDLTSLVSWKATDIAPASGVAMVNGVWGSDANNVWAVGWTGLILRYIP